MAGRINAAVCARDGHSAAGLGIRPDAANDWVILQRLKEDDHSFKAELT